MRTCSKKSKRAGVDVGPVVAGAGDGAGDEAAVFDGDLVARGDDVGAVDGETGGDFADGAADFGAGVVALVAVLLAKVDEEGGEAVDVGAEGFLGDGDLLIVGDGREAGGLAGEVAVDFGQGFHAVALYEQAEGYVEEVVAAGALDGPGGLFSGA